MNKTIRRFLLGALTVVAALELALAPVSLAFAQEKKIICTPSSGIGSNKDLYTCIMDIYEFAIILGLVFAVLFIVIAGYFYMFSAGNEKRVGKAKEIIGSTIAGVVILLAGLLLFKQINPEILNLKKVQPPNVTDPCDGQNPPAICFDDNSGGINGGWGTPPPPNGGGGNCDFGDGCPPPNGGGVTIPSGSAQDLAKKILADRKITLLSGDNSSARQNILDTSEGRPAKTSARSQVGVTNVALDPTMLGVLLALSSTGNIQVNAIAGGRHTSANSAHYKGKAFDIQSRGNNAAAQAQVAICLKAGANPKVTKWEPPTSPGGGGHVHCQW